MRLLQRHIALELQSIEDWSIPTFCPNPLSSGRIIWLWYATELFLMHCNGLILWLQWHHSTINMWSHLHRCNSFVLPRFDDFSFYQCYWSGSQLKATFLNKILISNIWDKNPVLNPLNLIQIHLIQASLTIYEKPEHFIIGIPRLIFISK